MSKVVHKGHEVKWSNPNFKAAKILCNTFISNNWSKIRFYFSNRSSEVTCKKCLKIMAKEKGSK